MGQDHCQGSQDLGIVPMEVWNRGTMSQVHLLVAWIVSQGQQTNLISFLSESREVTARIRFPH